MSKVNYKMNATETRLHNIIHEHSGQLLSKYINSKSRIIVKCKLGHEWTPIADNILRGHWCKSSHYNSVKTETSYVFMERVKQLGVKL